MRHRLREVLVNSHVGAVAIAVLLLWALNGAFLALWGPVSRVGTFLYTAVAIFGIPYFNPQLDRVDRNMLMITFFYFVGALVNLVAAWLLSRWLYRVGPLQSLRACGATAIGRNHV